MLETQDKILAIQTVEVESEGLGVLYSLLQKAFFSVSELLCFHSVLGFLGDTLLEEIDPEVLSMGQWKLPVDRIC